jgi:MFS family permease
MQIFLLVGGMCWALINIHSYPMVVDMTTAAKIGLYTGIYYLFSSLSQMAGPFLVGLFMDLLGNQFMFISSMLFMLISFFFISGVRIVHKNGKMAQTNENVERTI